MTILKKKYKVSLLVILAIIISRMMVTSADVDMQSLTAYCKNKGYSTEYCILVDFSRPSGTKRFFIYSFKDEKILYKSLCTNGCGKEKNIFNSTFSNEIGSNYSSLGEIQSGQSEKDDKRGLWERIHHIRT
jgi:hypothetical protein